MMNTMKRNFLFWLMIALLSMMISSTTFAQAMQSVNKYSDAWVGFFTYVYGSGTTEESPNYYNHTMKAQVTLTSPNGRSSSYATEFLYHATAQVSLPYDENDQGNYNVVTSHFDYCPIAYATYGLGTTYASVQTALTKTWYFCPDPGPYPLSGGRNCTYAIDCTVRPTCRVGDVWATLGNKPWVNVTVPVIDGTCYANKFLETWSDNKRGDCETKGLP